jgi:hypothetical protein
MSHQGGDVAPPDTVSDTGAGHRATPRSAEQMARKYTVLAPFFQGITTNSGVEGSEKWLERTLERLHIRPRKRVYHREGLGGP